MRTIYTYKNEEISIRSYRYTPEEMEYLIQNYKGKPHVDLTAELNAKFKANHSRTSVQTFLYNNGLKNGLDTRLNGSQGAATRFKAGVPSKYKGITLKERGYSDEALERMKAGQFKKGNRSHNALPVGTVIKDSEGYLKKKIAEPNVWKHLHRILWEEANGDVPMGYKVFFLDGNRENIKLENLAMARNDTLAKRSKYGTPENLEMGKAIHALSELEMAIERKDKKLIKRKKKEAEKKKKLKLEKEKKASQKI